MNFIHSVNFIAIKRKLVINKSGHLSHGCRSVTDTYSSGGDDLFIHPPLMNRYYVRIDTHDLSRHLQTAHETDNVGLVSPKESQKAREIVGLVGFQSHGSSSLFLETQIIFRPPT